MVGLYQINFLPEKAHPKQRPNLAVFFSKSKFRPQEWVIGIAGWRSRTLFFQQQRCEVDLIRRNLGDPKGFQDFLTM